MNRHKALLIISSLDGGGAARVLTELASSLADSGFDVAVLTLEGKGARDAYPLDPTIERRRIQLLWPSSSLRDRLASMLRRWYLLRHAILDMQPDVVLSFIDTTNIRVLASLLFTRIPVVVSERTDPRHHQIGRTWTLLRRYLYRTAGGVVVQTGRVADWMRGELGGRPVTVIPNALRIAQPVGNKLPKANPAARGLISVGRLVASKRFDLLIRAFVSTGLASAGWTLVILGEGPERARLEALLAELGCAANVSLPGHVADVAATLDAADIFVMTSEYEGFPNALLEAMQAGLACISTDCESGPRELITDGKDGLLIPVNDPDFLARAMIRLACDGDLRMSLARAAFASCQRFEPQAVTALWRATLLGAIARQS
nr:glycosyltransferase family 4 protein [uncultured Gellertiella sp.]